LNEDIFWMWAKEAKIDDAHDFKAFSWPASIRMFGEQFWPRFQALVRAELNAEAEVPAHV
jgi:hypothetical protein